MKCPRCQQHNPSHAMFCLQCGAPVRRSAADDASEASYTELQRSLTEALARESATGEILRVLSGSPPAIQPVLDAIVGSAARLCGSLDANIFQRDGGQLVLIAHQGPIPVGPIGEFTVPMIPGTAAGRSVLEGRTVHVADMQTRGEEFREGSEIARRHGDRTILAVPLIREGSAIGVIVLRRTESKLFTDRQVALLQTFADQAMIAIENVRLFTEREGKNRALTEAHAQVSEALEQQTATAEILRVISSSPTDVQPVFDAIVANAARLCDAEFSVVTRFNGGLLHLVAVNNMSPAETAAYHTVFPRPPGRHFVVGRAFVDAQPVHVEDIETDPDYDPRTREIIGRAARYRTFLGVPILRDGVSIGAIGCGRHEMKPFTATQIELVKTFADQAVIAIENVRLFTELQEKNRALTQAHAQVTESLEQQTATSDILRAISSSQTDVQPVFETIARSAVRLCDGVFGGVLRVEGDMLHLVADHNFTPDARAVYRQVFPIGLTQDNRRNVSVRAVIDRTVVHISDIREEPDFSVSQRLGDALRFRAILSVPMLREGSPIGAISIARAEAGFFSSSQVDLLQTFADQAVIAIENVRLFKELEARNKELTEALEQQTATSEILRAISSSPTDVRPIFEIIAERAVKLCDAELSVVSRLEGEQIQLAAMHGLTSEVTRALRFPMSLDAESTMARAIRSRAVVHVQDVLADPHYQYKDMALVGRWRGTLGVPLVREGEVIGAIFVARANPGRFSDKQIVLLQTFADQAVIAIENVRLFNETKEALEQQTATADILRVISSSPTNVQPVFDAIAQSAMRLCSGNFCNVLRFDGDLLQLAAQAHITAEGVEALERMVPTRPTRATVAGRVVLETAVVHLPDLQQDVEYDEPLAAAVRGRSAVGVPMLREGQPIGVIVVGRSEPQPYAHKQIELLKTFADQAVIAIENVRLFTELQEKNQALTAAHAQVTEALEQQTATADILRVISSSPTDLQPVLDAVAERAARLCNADDVNIHLVDGDTLRLTAKRGTIPTEETRPIVPTRHIGRAVVERRTIHVQDMRAARDEFPDSVRRSRTALATPLLRQGSAIGVIQIRRLEVHPFSEKQIKLLETFADQAVIAIENVRLFTELQEKHKALTKAHAQATESLEQQTATADILRVISSSPTDAQPVFEAIGESVVRLMEAAMASVYEFDGTLIHLRTLTPATWPHSEALRQQYPRPPDVSLAAGRVILERAMLHLADLQTDPATPSVTRRVAERMGLKSVLWVPMLREGEPIGVIGAVRGEAGFFSDDQVRLLQTFADQAVIAIENVRLFKELQARTGELTRSVGELRALGEVSQALSSTLDVDVVLNTIVTRANDLIGADGCTIFEYDEVAEQFHLRATRNLEPRLVELARGTPLRKGDQGILGQLPMGRQAVQVPDITAGSYSSPISDALIEAGYRAVVAVPLIREDHLIGALTMNRKTPGEFAAETIELLQTFATQSALAIQNARLFREIEIKSRELEVASQHKSEFLANMSHELRTPLNAIIGFSEVLGERMFGELNEKQDEYLKDIHASGQHLLSLINDILDLSKIEAGRMELEVTDFDLPMAIDNALTLIRERAARRNIALHTTVDERLGQVQADERKIRQVLLNLLSNAVKFTPEGGRIEIGAKPVNGFIEVSVTDTGVGIAPEDQEAVFEEFKQVGTADKKVEGTGLGLALSRKFIELHGGKIWVRSEVGKGSTFTFTVPVRRGE
jgi:GAF domain-containing protein